MSAAAYRSFRDQSLHYFRDRKHDAPPSGPVRSPACWTGPEMKARADWLVRLTPEQIKEVGSAADALMERGVAMEMVTATNFPLPRLSAEINRWAKEIDRGRGFVVVRGLPVADWGEEKSALAYWGIGHHLGEPGAQNPQNELLGHVVDYGEEATNPIVRRYRTTGNIDFHCDIADVVGLLCLQVAKDGGQSRIASSVEIFNRLEARAPDLTHRLFSPFKADRRGEEKPGERGYFEVTPCRYSESSGLRTFYHSEYFRSVDRLVPLEPDVRRILDLYDEIASSPEVYLDMWLQQGDMQFISNHTIVHARTQYQDHPERERRRHLLRLWLSLKAQA